ncbi:hypothetical protein NZ35_13080 [Pseudomonas chlororaphis]|uniref:Uncharacterized protein n=1 Tax=Pseudomonas chlororaphis TaxID=587753 RepID=A0A0A6FJJ1_9PSED|nr:hypothetical protein NZ35_13080 [Pseudomonas chlororaphis]
MVGSPGKRAMLADMGEMGQCGRNHFGLWDMCCPGGPHRWQASSHDVRVVHNIHVHQRNLWELACQR